MLAYLALSIVVAGLAASLWSRRRRLQHIPGPPSPSWLYGNLCQLLLPVKFGDYEFEWQRKYGPVYRIKGCFGEDHLMVSDPAALKHVLADTAIFARSVQQQHIVDMLIGKHCVFYVEGNDHKRIRNVLNTAFSPTSIRGLPPMFKRVATTIADRWQSMLVESKGAIDIYPTLHDATLDAVGEGAMGYEFHSLENTDSELASSHRNIIAASGVRSKHHIMMEAAIPYLPDFLLQIMLRLPSEAFKLLRHNKELGSAVSVELVKSQIKAVDLGLETKKDLLDAMVRANNSAKVNQRMTIEEMQEQIPSLMIAGQDTTGNTLSWAIYQLARDQSLQRRIREELFNAVKSADGLQYSDIESLKLFNAFLKEVLRLHPGLPMSDRVATQDAVLPLAEPILTTDGKRITELPIKKGQHIHVATASYNRLRSIWGPRAEQFDPSRWLDGEASKSQGLGPYANLATFFGGARVCLGWRFAVTELQVILPELIMRFTFNLAENVEILETVAVNLMPTSDGIPALPIVLGLVEQ